MDRERVLSDPVFNHLQFSEVPAQPGRVESVARRILADPLHTGLRGLEKVVMDPIVERRWTDIDRNVRRFSQSRGHELSVLQIGANDGLHYDPLRPYLAEYPGWSGVLVEPNPHAWQKLSQLYAKRSNITALQAAISDRDGKTILHAAPFTSNGRPNPLQGKDTIDPKIMHKHFAGINRPQELVREIEVDCLTFDSLLERSGLAEVDWLAIDTEGHDKTILDQIDFSDFRPKFVLFEHIHMSRDDRSNILSRLHQAGYSTAKLRWDTFASLGE